MPLTWIGYAAALITAFLAGNAAAERVGKGAASWGWSRQGSGWGLAIGGMFGFGVAMIALLAAYLLGPAWAILPEEGIDLAWLAPALLTLLVKTFLVALEETVYRGSLLFWLNRKIGLAGGVLVTALLFALTHYATMTTITTVSLVYLFSAGVVWALLAARTGSLWFSAGWHLAQNLWVWLLFDSGFNPAPPLARVVLSHATELWGASGQAGWVDCGLTLAAGLLLTLFIWTWRKETP